MIDFKIRPVTDRDFEAILMLNQAAIKATAAMDLIQLQNLNNWADYHQVVTHKNQVIAFLLVLPGGKPYQSPNYQWFNSHYHSFLYVDRIVVDEKFIGMKIGSMLYQGLFAYAKNHEIEFITCEYNIKPMNTNSQFFHQRFGFTEVATQWLDNKTKQVSLQRAQVES